MTAILHAAPWLLVAASLLWVHSLRSSNASHVDILWPLHHLMVCISMCLTMPNLSLRATLLLVLITVWAIRLATHLSIRSAGRGEDRRYAEIRVSQGSRFKFASLFVIYLLQALLALLISAAFLPILESPAPWTNIDTILFALIVFGLAYEVVADLQLSAFLQTAEGAGQRESQVLNTGLWALSRHPNYFGEWCFWLGISLLCIAAGSWLGLLSIALVSWLLLRFSGIKRMESLVHTRRPNYRNYQQSAPAFFPAFLNPFRFLQRRKDTSTTKFLALLCFAPLLFYQSPSQAVPPASEHWHFKAYIDNREIGYHSFDVSRENGKTYLSSRADFTYRLWRVPLFAYTHQVTERYDENLCLQSIESTTQTRSKKTNLKGERTATGFAVTSAGAGETTELNIDCLSTFAYWTPKLLTQTQLLNGQDGRLMPVTISPVSQNNDEPAAPKSYRLTADSLDLTLHYSHEGRWVGLESALPAGRRLVYKLEAYQNLGSFERTAALSSSQ